MSWRTIEMQIALPRSQDVGKLQEQLQQRGPHMQQSLREEGKMQEEIRRSQVNEMDQNDHVRFHSEEEQTLQNVPEKSIENKTKENHHPYLGKNIDYNG